MANNKDGQKEKLCVVGWTDYDDEYFARCKGGDEAFDAVVESVREHGFLFGGDAHQDYSRCCPVLSDGTKYCFSWRGWGAVIAAAYDRRGANGKLDHMSGYMDMMIKPSAIKRPDKDDEVDFSKITTPRYFRKLRLPPAHEYGDYTKFLLCPYNDEIKKIQPLQYLELHYKDDPERPLFESVKVIEIITGNSYSEVYRQADEMYYGDPELFGIPDAKTEEQVIEGARNDYPQANEADGVACIVYEYVRDGDVRFGNWIELKD